MTTKHSVPVPDPSISTSEDRLLTPAMVAEMLAVKPSTLNDYRSSSPVRGPRFIRLSSKIVRYKLSAVQEFIAAQESRV